MKGVVSHARVLIDPLRATLDAEARHHLERVLRLREGDAFTATDGQGNEAVAVLGRDGAWRAEAWERPGREPPVRVTLFPALLKGDRFEGVLEKAVELGVGRVVPVQCARSVAGTPSLDRLDRWRRIAVSAMLQCGGCRKPRIEAPLAWEDLPRPGTDVTAIFLHEEILDPPAGEGSAEPGQEVWLASGPEGGFSDEEVARFRDHGWKSLNLGPRRLRADTAPIAAAAIVITGFWGQAGQAL